MVIGESVRVRAGFDLVKVGAARVVVFHESLNVLVFRED